MYIEMIILTIISCKFKPLSSILLYGLTTGLFILLIPSGIGAKNSTNFHINQENTRFAFARCQNESNAPENLIKFWNKWKYPNNKLTHCYIKCFLYKLGLINLKHMGLDEHKFRILLSEELDGSDEIFTKDLFTSLDSTCQSYYHAWLLLIDNFGIYNLKNCFLKVSKGKTVGETATTFCNKNLAIDTKRNRTTSNSIDCIEKCIYQYFHYIDAYGRVDVKEIIYSYNEATKSSLKQGNEYVDFSFKTKVEKCAHNANQLYFQGLCYVATSLHECLLDEDIYYSNVFKLRDKITAYY